MKFNNIDALADRQLSLFNEPKKARSSLSYYDRLVGLLAENLDFHNQLSNYASHNFHSFPAKFPPQLPKLFIHELTEPNDIVLDPMLGSGTTLVEAFVANRRGFGFDIDPLAIKISKVKTTPLHKRDINESASRIYLNAKNEYNKNEDILLNQLEAYFESKTKQFLDNWFLVETQLELFCLWKEIQRVKDKALRNYFEVVFSSTIITKSGGVSLALDLGHTRPHKVKALFDASGTVIYGDENFDLNKKRYITKTKKSAFEEFVKKTRQNINSVLPFYTQGHKPAISFGDSQNMSLTNNSVDLIITSPPYASNAIDYMRAHKFSLVWFGYPIDKLTEKRNEYIGSESTRNYMFESLPEFTTNKILEISNRDKKRGNVLRRYYSEMKKSLAEMHRVLKPQKAAVVVVGSSVMKGIDTETHHCLKDIGLSLGFQDPIIGVRKLDRNKRMMPAGMSTDYNSQIQKRMHEEYVIGFYKP